jgi:hypothetical protein
MEALRLILAAVGCFGLLAIGSCTMLGMGTAAVLNEAVENQRMKAAERASSAGADSSRFSAQSRYEYESSREPAIPRDRTQRMNDSEWKFGDPAMKPSN